jgi:hypothetical protein
MALTQVSGGKDKRLIRDLPDSLVAHLFAFLSLGDIQHAVNVSHGRRVQLGTIAKAAGAATERLLLVPISSLVLGTSQTGDDIQWQRIGDLIEHATTLRRLSLDVSTYYKTFQGDAGTARFRQIQVWQAMRSHLTTFEFKVHDSNQWEFATAPSFAPILELPSLRHLTLSGKESGAATLQQRMTQLVLDWKAAKPPRLDTVDICDWCTATNKEWMALFETMPRPPTKLGLSITHDDTIWPALAKLVPKLTALRIHFNFIGPPASGTIAKGLSLAFPDPLRLTEFELTTNPWTNPWITVGILHVPEFATWRQFTNLRILRVPYINLELKTLDVWSSELKEMEHFSCRLIQDATARTAAVTLTNRWPRLRTCAMGKFNPPPSQDEVLAFVREHAELEELPYWCGPLFIAILREWTRMRPANIRSLEFAPANADEVAIVADCVRTMPHLNELILDSAVADDQPQLNVDRIVQVCPVDLTILNITKFVVTDASVVYVAEHCPYLVRFDATAPHIKEPKWPVTALTADALLMLMRSCHHLKTINVGPDPSTTAYNGPFDRFIHRPRSVMRHEFPALRLVMFSRPTHMEGMYDGYRRS